MNPDYIRANKVLEKHIKVLQAKEIQPDERQLKLNMDILASKDTEYKQTFNLGDAIIILLEEYGYLFKVSSSTSKLEIFKTKKLSL